MLKISRGRLLALAILLIIILILTVLWVEYLRKQPLEGIVSGNGRLEAEEVDISTKYAGRVLEIYVDEGDEVRTGQVLARMNTDSLEAELKEARAMQVKAIKEKDRAVALMEQRKSENKLAERNLERSKRLFQKGVISEENMDQAETTAESSNALYKAAGAEVENAQAAIDAADARIDRLKVEINESELISPVNGRVQYRLAEPEEVLPAGGRVLTVIDLRDVYMTIFLPTLEAGKVSIGSDARILLDALPDEPLHSKVTFVASEAQFTPKEVETKTERQKLSFRIKVTLVDTNKFFIKPGMPGEAFVRINDAAKWPEFLR